MTKFQICVILNTSKGKEIAERSNVVLIESKWEKCLPYNPRIGVGYKPFCRHTIERMIMPYAFQHFSKETIKKIYVRKINSFNPVWLGVKIVRLMHYKLILNYQRFQIRKLIKRLK